MKKKLLIFSFFMLITNIVGAQQGNIWTFWDGQGLDFNNGKPSIITSKISLICSQDATSVPSTISDCDGKLLFYSAGSRTLNAKHDTIKGAAHCIRVTSVSNPKSAHAIMERKDSLGKYILVYGVPNLNVQLVDMNANSGNGSVYRIMADIEKDIFNNGAYTKSAFDIQYHPNDTDFWIICRPTGSFFRVIHFSPIYGVKNIIDSYDVRQSFSLQGNNGIAVRFSRKGDLVAAGAHYDGIDINSAYIYNFDNITGLITNPEPICDTTVHIEAQITDFEFSPNDTFVYFKSNPLKSSYYYYLIQTRARGEEKVKNAKQIFKNVFYGLYGLSLGPDNKIYTADAGSKYINIIHQPDREFPDCYYKENEILMPSSVGHFFPKNRSPIHQIYINNSSTKGFCSDTTWLSIKGDTGYYGSYTLWWGDGKSEILDNSKLSNLFHVYKVEGNYEIKLRALTADCNAQIWRYDSAFVNFNEPRAMLLQDEIKTYCGGKEINFHDSMAATMYYMFSVHNIQTNDTLFFLNDTLKNYDLSFRSVFSTKKLKVENNDSIIFKLNVSNQHGCKAMDSFIYIADIDTFPKAEIQLVGNNEGCAPIEISIKNNSKYADSLAIIWGDGSQFIFNDAVEISNHIYTKGIQFNPKLMVKNKDGCIDSAQLSEKIKVLNPAKANYLLTIDSTCEFGKVSFEDFTENSDYVITLIKSQSTDDTLYFDSTIFFGNNKEWKTYTPENISIYRFSENELCSSDSFQNIALFPKKIPQIKLVASEPVLNNGGSKCEPVNVSFTDSIDEGNTEAWIFYSNVLEIPKTGLSAFNEILTRGNYISILKDSSNNGCTNSDTLSFTILPQPVYDYVLDIKMLCEKWQASISVKPKDKIVDSVYVYWQEDKKDNLVIGDQAEFNIKHIYDFVTNDTIRNIYIATKHNLGCIEKDTFSFVQKSYRILEATNVLGISVNNPNEIILEWEPVPFAKNYELIKDNKTSIITDNTPYIKQNEPTDKSTIGYYITAIDTCGIKGDTSRLSKTILLQGKVVENFDEIEEAVLTWTPYENWQNGVANYFLQLQDDNGFFNDIVSFDSLNFQYTDTEFSKADLNEYCYRIKALENGGNNYESKSNIICLAHKPWLIVPNAFSPNNDGLNDIFRPHFLSIKYIKMNITNHWGEIVYEYEGKNPIWDGTFKNKPALPGGYVIQISALHLNGKLVNYKGIINLIK